MIDLDTSVVALLAPEERLISSDWLITEKTYSHLGIKQRHHGLSAQSHKAAGDQFEWLLQGGGAAQQQKRRA